MKTSPSLGFTRRKRRRTSLVQTLMAFVVLVATTAVAWLTAPPPQMAHAAVTSCSAITATDVYFDDYIAGKSAPAVQTTGQFTITCQADSTGSQNVAVKISNGLGAHCPQYMFKNTTKLEYSTYQKSDYSSAWCNNNKNFAINFLAKNTNTTATFTYYPEITSNQNLAVYGDYQDTLTMTTVTSGADATTTFYVNGHIPGACSLSTTNLAFGTYTGATNDNTATVTVNCTNTAPYSVSLGAGSNDNGSSRRMAGPSGQYLSYALYSDSGRTTPWGNGTTYGAAVSGTGAGSDQNLTVYGRVTSGQRPTPGSYSDTVVVTLQY